MRDHRVTRSSGDRDEKTWMIVPCIAIARSPHALRYTRRSTPTPARTIAPMTHRSADEAASDTPVQVRQLRVVVEAADFEAAVAFYRDVLGLAELESIASDGGAHVVILDAGRATLELANPAQTRLIDDVEVGRRVSPHIRLAFEVDDTARRTRALEAAGATVLAPPTLTPWRSLNSRLHAPADVQLTLFEELDS